MVSVRAPVLNRPGRLIRFFGKTCPDLDLFPTSGSSNGQKDFEANQNHFGAGDIPFKEADHTEISDTIANGGQNKPFFHIPFQLGAIEIFHSVPDSAGKKVELDACTLAKIFSRTIKYWDHEDIKKLNPTLNIPANQAIKVATRTSGSSSTSLTSQYLDLLAGANSQECPGAWSLHKDCSPDPECPEKKYGSKIKWPTDVEKVVGSSGMSSYLGKNEWAIGYVDAGHGWEKNLKEVELKNKNGEWVTSKTAEIEKAGTSVTLPPSFKDSWHNVSLMNAAGDTTFPITTFSYMYIHENQPDGESARLLEAFATFVLSDEGQDMLEDFGFVKLATDTLTKSRDALASVNWGTSAAWEFETADGKVGKDKDGNTIVGGLDSNGVATGANGLKVFSGKRGAWGDYERGVIKSDLEKLATRVATLEGHHEEPVKWYEDPQNQIDSALALGSLAFILGFIGTVLGGVALTRIKRASGGKYSGNIV